MVPVEWPIAVSASDRSVEPARRAGRGRLATVRRDFFLDPAERLTEQERALMTAMLEGILAECADELRSGAGPGAAANDDGGLLAELRESGLLDMPELVALFVYAAASFFVIQHARHLGSG